MRADTCGDQLGLALSIDLEDEKRDLVVPAVMFHRVRADEFRIGLLLQNLSQKERLLLYHFVLSSAE